MAEEEAGQHGGFTEPPRIDPKGIKLNEVRQDVLNLIGLDPMQIQEYTRLQEETLKTFEKAGKEYYSRSKQQLSNSNFKVEIGNQSFMLRTRRQPGIVPDLLDQWQTRKEEVDPIAAEEFDQQLNAWLLGYGKGALEAKDWPTSFYTFDTLTPGGMIKNEELTRTLQEATQEDFREGVKIAQFLEAFYRAKGATGPPELSSDQT